MPRQNMFLLQQLLIISLIYQLFLSHGSWATRTPAAAPAPAPALSTTTSPTPSPLTTTPLVSSSEATLLTTHRFFGTATGPQMQRFLAAAAADPVVVDANEISASSASATEEEVAMSAETVDPSLSASDTATNSVGGGNRSKNRYKILSVLTNCTRDLFEMHIQLNRGFRGLLYAKDFPLECRARGNTHSNVTLRLPTSGCGVRAEPRADGNMELSVRVMLQMEQKLRQSSDILRMVKCKLPLNAMGMTVMTMTMTTASPKSSTVRETKSRKSYRNGRMRILQKNSAAEVISDVADDEDIATHQSSRITQPVITTSTTTPATSSASGSGSTPRVRIWLELGGPDGSGAVEVGQPTTLTVRAIVPGTMGVRVVDCAALDGLGESTQQLLDDRGCPIDEQVMPALRTRFKPAEEGWSKHRDDDLVEKLFSATFPAFKFPDRERLHVSCGVQLCKGKCPNLNCRAADKLNLSADKHLARIEVFNSLAVTAPQIEVDRLSYDRRYNMSVEEYPPNIRPIQTEGTLCLSVSKLAISFCVLGLIFLVAIIVAISSLIRSRRRTTSKACALTPNGNRMHRTEVCTSMFSSSSESAQSARFGGKLFMPYYPNTLPYGRVY